MLLLQIYALPVYTLKVFVISLCLLHLIEDYICLGFEVTNWEMSNCNQVVDSRQAKRFHLAYREHEIFEKVDAFINTIIKTETYGR